MIVKLILYYAIVVAISFVEYKFLGLKKQTNAFYVYIILLLVSSTLITVHTLGIHIPNPLIGLRYIFEPIGKLIENGLGVDAS